MEHTYFIAIFIYHILVEEEVIVEVLVKVPKPVGIEKLAATSCYTKLL